MMTWFKSVMRMPRLFYYHVFGSTANTDNDNIVCNGLKIKKKNT